MSTRIYSEGLVHNSRMGHKTTRSVYDWTKTKEKLPVYWYLSVILISCAEMKAKIAVGEYIYLVCLGVDYALLMPSE